ncbi:MAG: hypothetical protein K2Q30_10645, partial [Gemmataceae bacterium]|nr:hypothetical protein [Gemmataceae bacterium]
MTKVAGNTVEVKGFTASENELPASFGNTIVGAKTGVGLGLISLGRVLAGILGMVGLVQSLSV